jgi:hypothetical protein
MHEHSGIILILIQVNNLKGVLIVEESERQPWSQEWVWLLDIGSFKKMVQI